MSLIVCKDVFALFEKTLVCLSKRSSLSQGLECPKPGPSRVVTVCISFYMSKIINQAQSIFTS